MDRITDWLRNDLKGERGPYGYPDRPMREEVLREFRQPDGGVSGVVSRNSYGCHVLNTASGMFVDVDEKGTSLLAGLKSLFGGGKFEPNLLAKVQRWIDAHPHWGWRVYRTRAGIRLLATHQPFPPDDPVCQTAFHEFGADWLYRKLCANQKCFRARLTPKPWRCDAEKPPHRWPWRDAAAQSAFEEWDRRYQLSASGHATCRLLGQFGNPVVHATLEPLVRFHDDATRAQSGLPLA
ncbi:MAG: hypothetical protein ACKV19_29080 [Verrucomicrobiales bacterium]